MTTLDELHSAIDRFNSVKQHRDIVETQYQHLRNELAAKFDNLNITSIKYRNMRVRRTHLRYYDYDFTKLRRQLTPETYEFITDKKLVIISQNLWQAIRTGATTQQIVDKCRTIRTETNVIKINQGNQ